MKNNILWDNYQTALKTVAAAFVASEAATAASRRADDALNEAEQALLDALGAYELSMSPKELTDLDTVLLQRLFDKALRMSTTNVMLGGNRVEKQVPKFAFSSSRLETILRDKRARDIAKMQAKHTAKRRGETSK